MNKNTIIENNVFNAKLLRTIAKLGLTNMFFISSKEAEDTTFMYSEYDNNAIPINCII